jgi:hypothetical protein
MGIRVNKIMGYGVELTRGEAETYVNFDNWFPSESKAAGYLQAVHERVASSPSATGVPLDLALFVDSIPKKVASSFYRTAILLNDEYVEDFPVTLIITPLGVINDWHRNDDSVDYQESLTDFVDGEEMATVVKFLDAPPFPFYKVADLRKESKSKSNLDLVEVIRLTNSYLPEDKVALEKLLWEDFDVLNLEELQKSFTPVSPQSVHDIANYLCLFTDEALQDNIFRKLKPCIVTYWQ